MSSLNPTVFLFAEVECFLEIVSKSRSSGRANTGILQVGEIVVLAGTKKVSTQVTILLATAAAAAGPRPLLRRSTVQVFKIIVLCNTMVEK